MPSSAAFRPSRLGLLAAALAGTAACLCFPAPAIAQFPMGTLRIPHLLMEEVAAAAKAQLTHVPYTGNADLMQSLLGGDVMAARCACWSPSASTAPSAGRTYPPRRTWAAAWCPFA